MPSHRTTRARRAPRIVALSAALGLIAGITTAVPAAFAESEAPPVVFIIDASGSMVRETSPGETRMDVAKTAVNETLASLPEGTETGILVFGTGTGNSDAERAAGCTDVKTVAPLAAVAAAELAVAVDGIEASGFTPIGPALRQAADMLPSGEPASIVLVSDGVDTCAPPPSCEVASEVHRANPNIAIHVVAFGVDDDEAAQQQMTCIGGVGGGTSTTASDPQQLAARLRAASDPNATASLLSEQGLHGVSLGMTLAEVRASVDGAKVGETTVIDGVEIIVVNCGWGTVELRDNRVYSIAASDEQTSTAEGVAPGDPISVATQMYGEPVDAGTTTGGVSWIYRSQPGSPVGYRMYYSGQNDTITRIIVCRCVPASAIATDMAQWQIGFDGVGPLTLGMTTVEAMDAAPGLGSDGSITVDGVEVLTTLFHDDRLVAVRVGGWDIVPGSVAWWGPRLPHARGIRLGDTGGTALNTFPEASFLRVVAGGISALIFANREGRTMTFETWPYPGQTPVEGRSVEDSIRAGQVGTVTLEDSTATKQPNAWEKGTLG